MSQKKKTPRRSTGHGPLNLDDLHLTAEDADGLARRYGTLVVAQERYEELLERGDLTGAPWDSEAFWSLAGPEELRAEPWVEYRIYKSHPELFAEQERELEAFRARRTAWLEANGHL